MFGEKAAIFLSDNIRYNGREEMEKLEGYVEHIIFRNTENGYTVMNVVAEEEEITCGGSLLYIDEG